MKRKIGTCIVSLLMTVVLVWHAPLAVLAAGIYYIDFGNIEITAGQNGHTVNYFDENGNSGIELYVASPVVTQDDPNKSTRHTVTITADTGQTANVTLQDVNIDTSTQGTAAVTVITQGNGSVNIELNGTNTLKSGDDHAGLEKQDVGHLTIMDADRDGGSLTATGGIHGAGIGGGKGGNASNITSNITISGGTVTASGGLNGAGIGGGLNGAASDIRISGGTVTASGGQYGAGIGGGGGSAASDIRISGGTVTASGGLNGAGIGGGDYGTASDITISGGTVNATGGSGGAGIGGGYVRNASKITISGNAQVTAAGGDAAAGIGGGLGVGTDSSVIISENAQVKASGGKETAGYLSSVLLGSGAAIGNGGNNGSVNGTALPPDSYTSGLTTGSVYLYEPGTTIYEMESGTVQPLQLINGTPVTPGPTPVTPVTPGTTPATPGTTPVIPSTMPVIPVMSAFSGTGSGGSATPTASVKPVPQTKQNFDSVYYADNNPDLYEAYGYDHDLLWNHYVTVGRQEGRKVRFVEGIHKGAVDEGKGKEDFDAIAYADYYADLFAVYGYDEDALWNHYDTVGRAEGRLYFSRSA